MFGLISERKYKEVLKKYEELSTSSGELAIEMLKQKTFIEEAAKKHEALKEQLEECLALIKEKDTELEKLLTIEIEKTVSTFEVKEFGEEESLKQIEEACIEDVLEEVKSKIVVSKEKEYSIHKITAKITIKDGN